QASYPDKPLRILVGFVAGGPADIVAGVVGDKLTEAWGKPVVIENVTGSGGNMATERVAKTAPDGYTFLLGTSGPFVIHPSLAVQDHGRPRDPACPLPRHRGGDAGPARRSPDHGVLQSRLGAAARPRRQGAPARGHLAHTRAVIARPADHGGSGL